MTHKFYFEDQPADWTATGACREMIAAGRPEDDSIEVYRRRPAGDMLCIRIRNIGAGAKLEPRARGGFVDVRERGRNR